jgi:hypothetical protein
LVYVDDMTPLAQETTSEAQNLSQDLYHSLIQIPDSNPDAPGRGVGVLLYLNGTLTDLQGLPGKIEADFEKDSRVLGAAATLIQNPGSGLLSDLIQVQVQATVGVLNLLYGYNQADGLTVLS